MREKKGYNAGRQESTESLKENFDFEAGLNVFKKDEVLAKVAEEGEKQAEVGETLSMSITFAPFLFLTLHLFLYCSSKVSERRLF